MKKIYVLDGQRFSTLDEFFDEIERVLAPNSDWRRNLDALEDLLRGGFGTPVGGFVLRWKNAALSRERLGFPETVRQLRIRLERCHPDGQSQVEQQLKAAKKFQGATTFDWVMAIIRRHGPGGEEATDGIELLLD